MEGSEFERYGKKGLDSSKWDWQIGRRSGSDSDDDEDEEEGDGQRNRLAAGLLAKLYVEKLGLETLSTWSSRRVIVLQRFVEALNAATNDMIA